MIQTILEVIKLVFSNWRLALIVAGVIAVFGAGVYVNERFTQGEIVACEYEKKDERITALENALAALRETADISIAQLRRERDAERHALSEMRKRRDVLYAQNEANKRKLQDALAEKTNREWAETVIPSDVRDRLRDSTGTGSGAGDEN